MQKRETVVGVLDKAVAILLAFSREESMLTPAEIAARTHLSLPTVYRLAQALCIHGLLEQEEHYFRLGMELLRLGSLVVEANDLRRVALPHMHWWPGVLSDGVALLWIFRVCEPSGRKRARRDGA